MKPYAKCFKRRQAASEANMRARAERLHFLIAACMTVAALLQGAMARADDSTLREGYGGSASFVTAGKEARAQAGASAHLSALPGPGGITFNGTQVSAALGTGLDSSSSPVDLDRA